MTTEVSWALGEVKTNWPGTYPSDLERINGDDSKNIDTGEENVTADLSDANYVEIASASRSDTAIGTEYDHRVEQVIDVEIRAAKDTEWGNTVDSDGFAQLWRDIKTALLTNRSFPGVGVPDVTYHTVTVENEENRSRNYADHFEYRFSLRLEGYETLP